MITYPGLLINDHPVVDSKSKASAEFRIRGDWEYTRNTPVGWIEALEKGHIVVPGEFSPVVDEADKYYGEYRHRGGLWVKTWLIFADADNIRNVDFDKDGNDINPNGLEPWVEDRQLSFKCPGLVDDAYAVGQSVNSMSPGREPQHRRFRAAFLFDEPIESREHYAHILSVLAERHPIISTVERQPAQPVFGNGRKGYNQFAMVGNILKLSDFPMLSAEKGVPLKHSLFEKPKPSAENRGKVSELNVREYLTKHRVEWTAATEKERQYPNAVFVECPKKKDHTNPTYLNHTMVWETGMYGYCFECQHLSCGIENWTDYRKAAGLPEPKPTPNVSQVNQRRGHRWDVHRSINRRIS